MRTKRSALVQFWELHPDAKASLKSWYTVMRRANSRTPAEMKMVYPNTDLVGRRTVFNIAGNKYRLIARVRRLETMNTTTIELDAKAYGRLLRRTLPHVIRTDEEHERLADELMRLDNQPAPKEQELAELLTVLIERYEERRFPIRKASARQTLHHLMEARNLT